MSTIRARQMYLRWEPRLCIWPLSLPETMATAKEAQEAMSKQMEAGLCSELLKHLVKSMLRSETHDAASLSDQVTAAHNNVCTTI